MSVRRRRMPKGEEIESAPFLPLVHVGWDGRGDEVYLWLFCLWVTPENLERAIAYWGKDF